MNVCCCRCRFTVYSHYRNRALTLTHVAFGCSTTLGIGTSCAMATVHFSISRQQQLVDCARIMTPFNPFDPTHITRLRVRKRLAGWCSAIPVSEPPRPCSTPSFSPTLSQLDARPVPSPVIITHLPRPLPSSRERDRGRLV